MVTPFHVWNDTLELVPSLNNVTPIVGVAEINAFATATVQNRLSVFLF